jgi:pyridoxal phosphate-dependent aminotransferase EpsN
MVKNRIYLSPPDMSGTELGLVADVFKSNWIAPLGPEVDKFEKEFAKKNDVKYALATSSGTGALHLALKVLDISRGDNVFCSTLTFCATANPVVYEGANPVFIDSEKLTWNMDPNLLNDALKKYDKKKKLPKAVIVVHLYGQSADMNGIMDCCNKYEIPVIEDSAEALGALCGNKKVGTFGCMSIFSFNGNKIITTSGGGMLTSNNKGYIEIASHLATQAREPLPYYYHKKIGYNYRMSNVLSAIGRGQLQVLDKKIEKKRKIYEKYKNLLSDMSGITFVDEPAWSKGIRWLTCVLVEGKIFGSTCEDIRLELEKNNVESRPIWKPLHTQPIFSNCEKIGGEVSEKIFEDGLCLPSGTNLTDREIEKVCRIIKKCHKK